MPLDHGLRVAPVAGASQSSSTQRRARDGAQELDPEAHLAMQAALQPFVDGAIAKTINLPRDYPLERHREIFEAAHRLGLKACTVFRPNPSMEGVLSNASAAGVEVAAKECCLST